MRSRQIIANWLICAAFNAKSRPERFTIFSTDEPIGGDGDIEDKETQETWPTEHVLVPELKGWEVVDIEALILGAIALKQNKGQAAYAVGNAGGVAQRGRWAVVSEPVAKSLPKPLHFAAVWVVGLHGVEKGEYIYNVTQLDEEAGIAHVWRGRIAADLSN